MSQAEMRDLVFKRIPNPTGEDGEVEIRQIYDVADFDYAPPEVTKRFDNLSVQMAQQRK